MPQLKKKREQLGNIRSGDLEKIDTIEVSRLIECSQESSWPNKPSWPWTIWTIPDWEQEFIWLLAKQYHRVTKIWSRENNPSYNSEIPAIIIVLKQPQNPNWQPQNPKFRESLHSYYIVNIKVQLNVDKVGDFPTAIMMQIQGLKKNSYHMLLCRLKGHSNMHTTSSFGSRWD